jgi:hypothetical protein
MKTKSIGTIHLHYCEAPGRHQVFNRELIVDSMEVSI